MLREAAVDHGPRPGPPLLLFVGALGVRSEEHIKRDAASNLGGDGRPAQRGSGGDGDVVLSRIRREWVDRLDLCNPLDSDAWM